MEDYIYIENYLKLTQLEKGAFLKFIILEFNRDAIDQVQIFSEESIIMNFFEDVDIHKAYDCINKYFEDNSEIKIDIANKEYTANKKSLFLTYANKTINI